jgi:glycolate oxidase
MSKVVDVSRKEGENMRKDLLRSYISDASRLKGKALDVFHPQNLEEVRDIISKNKHILIRGAGTGLAGGAVPQNGQDVVVDLSKMKKISDFDKERLTIEVEAGVILDDLQDYVSEFGLEFPVNPSSHAVCTIGGMIATNAVGNRGVKYGKTSNWIKWVEVVDCYGNVDRKGITEMSDYIGIEGITGVVVRACLKLSPKKEKMAKLIRVENLESVIDVVKDLKRDIGISMIEFLDKIVSKLIGLGDSYYLIVEREFDGMESGGQWLMGRELDKLMALRDNVYPALAGEGYTRIEDPKIMIERFVDLMKWLEARGIPVFGHIGVGILHPCFNSDQEKFIPEMMDLVKRHGGQVSGEHGIGLLKRGFVEINDQKILRNIKKRTDPLEKFNIGKVI